MKSYHNIDSAVLAACVAVLAGSAAAQETVVWESDLNGWEVAVDRTINNSCFLLAGFANDFVLRLQVNKQQQNIQFIVGNIRWSSLKVGESYPISVAFGDATPWEGEGIGHEWSSILPSLVLSVPSDGDLAAHFLDEFAAMDVARVTFEGKEIANLSLADSAPAVSSLMDCVAAMHDFEPSDDPFAGFERKSPDEEI